MTDREIAFRGCCYAIAEVVNKGSTSFYTRDEDGIAHIMTWEQVVYILENCFTQR